MLLAELDGQTIGVLTLLLYKDVVYYWYTGTLRSHARARAGDLLVWHAIQLGHSDGYGVLDFGGAGKPDEPYGVRDFKAKYGGELVDFGRDVWVPAPLRLRLATVGYETMRRFL
jgi:lipid II:glycine glycyltransferase (peptidoglycan interpeptide bridge formation enzyme)